MKLKPINYNVFAPAKVTLITRRLILKHICSDDRKAILESELCKKDSLLRIIRNSKRSLMAHKQIDWAIYLKKDNIFIGYIHLRGFDYLNGCIIGFIISKKYRNCGYATEAVHKVVNFAYSKIKIHKISAGVDPSNKASSEVLRKCNFKKDGVFRHCDWGKDGFED
jgi:ribosomal-protein-alanine N-acetyltransferase